MIQIFEESDNSGVVIENQFTGKKIVVLFPMTRGKDANLFRWEKLISTVNISKVAYLVLIDKTPLHQATHYFAKREKEILANIVILQRPRNEPIHDSQSLITLESGLWIIQMHDDDDWEGYLEIPLKANDDTVVRTNFLLMNKGTVTNVTDPNWPDCRSIFSLLPSSVWNRFSRLIFEQGGHVAGSIDSSLNLVVNLIEPKLINTRFKYIYDNRHWSSRNLSKQHLIQLTKEDGWRNFATVEMSLVSRTIDGIASLTFFSDLYPDVDYGIQVEKWISSTKPNILRIYIKKIEMFFLIFSLTLLKIGGDENLATLQKSCSDSIVYRNILISAWDAKNSEDYLKIVEVLLGLQSFPLLQSRFYFWQRELKRKCL